MHKNLPFAQKDTFFVIPHGPALSQCRIPPAQQFHTAVRHHRSTHKPLSSTPNPPKTPEFFCHPFFCRHALPVSTPCMDRHCLSAASLPPNNFTRRWDTDAPHSNPSPPFKVPPKKPSKDSRIFLPPRSIGLHSMHGPALSQCLITSPAHKTPFRVFSRILVAQKTSHCTRFCPHSPSRPVTGSLSGNGTSRIRRRAASISPSPARIKSASCPSGYAPTT